ncbi:hypothetical protein OG21DRAFT_1523738 [Imleria badia]|nr:hypothetical protein OG21DRAFT_1523738 [Imleria badia]
MPRDKLDEIQGVRHKLEIEVFERFLMKMIPSFNLKLVLVSTTTTMEEPTTHTYQHLAAADLQPKVLNDLRKAAKRQQLAVGVYTACTLISQSENAVKRTLNKPRSVGKDVVEWDPKLVLSKVLASVIEDMGLGPILGAGEVLGRFEITIGELLDRNGGFNGNNTSLSYRHLNVVWPTDFRTRR